MGCAYKILFVEATVETIIKRYKETRRMHPWPAPPAPWTGGTAGAHRSGPGPPAGGYIIDTSNLSTAKLRGRCCACSGTAPPPRP